MTSTAVEPPLPGSDVHQSTVTQHVQVATVEVNLDGGAPDMSPDQLSSLIGASPDALLLYDADGVVRWASQSLYQVFAWRPKDVIGRPFFLSEPSVDLNSVDDDTNAQAQSTWNRWCAVDSTAWIQRCQAPRGDGRTSWIEEAVTVLRNGDGAVTAAVVSARDITAQVHAMEALVESDSFFRTIAECAADVTFQTNTDGVITWISDGVKDALDGTVDEVQGTPVQRWIDPLDRPMWDRAVESARSGRPLNVRVRLRRADGVRRWWEISAHPVIGAQATIVGLAGGWRLVDADIRREELLRDSEERLHAVVEHAGDLTMQVDPQGRIVWVSSAVGALLGHNPHTLVRAPLSEVLDLGQDGSQLRCLFDSGERAALTGWAISKRGERLPVHLVCRPANNTPRSSDWIVNAHVLAATGAQLVAATPPNMRATFRVRAGLVQWASPTLTTLLGWTPGDWVGNRFVDFVHLGDAAAVRRAVADDGPDTSGVVRCRVEALDGNYHWLELKVARMRRPDRQDTQVVAVLGAAPMGEPHRS